MKTITYLFIFMSFLLDMKAYCQSQNHSSPLPQFQAKRIATIDVKHLALDLQFDWKQKKAYGNCMIELKLLKVDDVIKLDAALLQIEAIQLNDGTKLNYEYHEGAEDGSLQIFLNRKYDVNEHIFIKIFYYTKYSNESDPVNLGGSSGKGIRFFQPSHTEPNKRKQIWSMGDASSNRYWFPSYDHPNDLRTTEFKATVDEKLTVISNGKLISITSNGNGSHTYHWKSEFPYANHLTSFVVGEYTLVKQKYDNISLNNYGYPDEAEGVEASVVRLPDMMRYFSSATGLKFPFDSYSQVFVQDFPNLAGNHTFSTITENMIDDYGTHADFFYLWDLTESEALAQQWFGNLITAIDWKDVWLNKSFAHYFNCLYNEYKNGKDEFLLYQLLYDQSSVYLADWNSGIRHPIVTDHYSDAFSFINDSYATSRGSLVLHMLKKQVGEKNWWKVVKRYVQLYAGKVVNTEHFKKVVEEVCGKDMGWFFEQWVYKMGHPIFEVNKTYHTPTKKLELIVKQIQKPDEQSQYPQSQFFSGYMNIEIDGKVKNIYIEAKAENKYTFKLEKAPSFVNFDFEGSWIKELVYLQPLEELIQQLQSSKDILGKYNAMMQLVTMAREEKTEPQVREQIYAELRKLIESKAYWRIRQMTMAQYRLSLAKQGSPINLDNATTKMLLNIVEKETSWMRASAITFLGMSHQQKYADVYLKYLGDSSDRVVNAAANALGKSKSPLAYDALIKLKDKPSWKNQSLISTLNGLKELGDQRGLPFALEAFSNIHLTHWTLATPVWDYRLAATETLITLGGTKEAYPIIFDRFKKSLEDDDINDIFSNVLIISKLGDPRGKEVFEILKKKYEKDEKTLEAIAQYENQFNDRMIE